jgi:hypothetical protein
MILFMYSASPIPITTQATNALTLDLSDLEGFDTCGLLLQDPMKLQIFFS